MKYYIIFAAILILFIIFCNFLIHEKTHEQIAIYYGATETKIVFQLYPLKLHVVDNSFCNDECYLAHSINDIVGYNIMPFLIMIIVFLLLNDEKETKKD